MSFAAPLADAGFDILFGILLFLFFLLSGSGLVWLVANVERVIKRWSERRHQVSGALGFPVMIDPANAPTAGRSAGPSRVAPLIDDGPGCYKFIGVASATATDVEMYIEAATLANAKVKAELAGVIVTDVVIQSDR